MEVAVLPLLISNWIYFFSAVIGLFSFWIKDNNGLIIDRNVDDQLKMPMFHNLTLVMKSRVAKAIPFISLVRSVYLFRHTYTGTQIPT